MTNVEIQMTDERIVFRHLDFVISSSLGFRHSTLLLPMHSSFFAQVLSQGVPVFDGAMGTEIHRDQVFMNQCFDLTTQLGRSITRSSSKRVYG
jgi:hypothetical protein